MRRRKVARLGGDIYCINVTVTLVLCVMLTHDLSGVERLEKWRGVVEKGRAVEVQMLV